MSIPIAWHSSGSIASDAPVVLLLHGFMGTGLDWLPLSRLLNANCKYLCPDLPGHGAVQHLPDGADCGMEALARAVVQELDKKCPGRVALAGYSMGGRLALYLAVHYPDKFSCLILESSSPGIAAPAARQARKQMDDALAEELESLSLQDGLNVADRVPAFERNEAFRAFLHRWYQQPLFSALQKRPELLESLIARRMRNTPRALAASLRGVGTGAQPGLWEHLSALKMPLLLITGAEDKKFTGIADAMKDLLPHAGHHSFPKCSHCPHEEELELFAAVLTGFLSKGHIPAVSG